MTDQGKTLDANVYQLHDKILESVPVKSSEIAAATSHDPILAQVVRFIQDGWPQHDPPDQRESLKPYVDRQHELTTQNGCVLWGLRVVVPSGLRERILDVLHETHTGVVKMKAVARTRVWWPAIDRDIEATAKSCSSCAMIAKDPEKAPLHSWEYPTQPWQRLHVDYAGPFFGRMFLVYVDAHSKYAGVIPMKSTSWEKTIDCLLVLFAQFGLPKQLVSDNGPQFVSDEFQAFLKRYGVQHLRSAPYHPATNGEAERFVQTFKRGLKAIESDTRSLFHKLQLFLLGYRSTAHSTTGRPPAELFFQRNIRAPIDLVVPSIHDHVDKMLAGEQFTRDGRADLRSFQIGAEVFARWYQGPLKWRAGLIVRRSGPMGYEVQVGNELVQRHIEQLRERFVSIKSRTFEEEQEQDNRDALNSYEQPDVPIRSRPSQVTELPPAVDASESPTEPREAAGRPKVAEAAMVNPPVAVEPKKERSRRDAKRPVRFDDEFSGLGSARPKH